jgi:hypothetical protein
MIAQNRPYCQIIFVKAGKMPKSNQNLFSFLINFFYFAASAPSF